MGRVELIAEIVEKGSDVRLGIRKNQMANEELQALLMRLYMMTGNQQVAKLHAQTKAIASDFTDALTRADQVMASNLLMNKVEQARKEELEKVK